MLFIRVQYYLRVDCGKLKMHVKRSIAESRESKWDVRFTQKKAGDEEQMRPRENKSQDGRLKPKHINKLH